MLTGAKLRDRIVAARTLRGWSQDEMNRHLAELGWGAQDGGRIERGDKALAPHLIPALAKTLGVPDAWFIDPDLDLTGHEPAEDFAANLHELSNSVEEHHVLFRGIVERVRDERVRSHRQIVERLDYFTEVVQRLEAIGVAATERIKRIEDAIIDGELERALRETRRAITQSRADQLAAGTPNGQAAPSSPETTGATPAEAPVRREGTQSS